MLADISWFIAVVGVWSLLIACWNTVWAIALVPVFALQLAGMGEVLHQAGHNNLFGRSRRLNNTLGRFVAAIVCVDLPGYRDFHRKHHVSALTVEDSERLLYTDLNYLALRTGWAETSNFTKSLRFVALIVHLAKLMASFGGAVPFVRAVRWSIPVVLCIMGLVLGVAWYQLPLMLAVTWYLPNAVFLVLDMLLVQSEHYGAPTVLGTGQQSAVPPRTQYELSWNLKLPAPVQFLLLSRNIHAEHHGNAGLHWSHARDQKNERTLPLGTFLKRLWVEGPRA